MQYLQFLLSQNGISSLVSADSTLSIMLATIDFNHKLCLRAVEIDYVVAYSLLSVELALFELF
jgi:hypothetical protein